MNTGSGERRAPAARMSLDSRIRLVSVAAAMSLIFCGGMVFISWLADIQLLNSIFPGWVTMKVNTAACFALSGASLWCLRDEQDSTRLRLAGCIFAIMVALVASLTLGENLLHKDFGIDQALVEQPLAAGESGSPGRMATVTASALLLISAALLGLGLRNAGTHAFAPGCALLIAAIGLLAVAGHVYEVRPRYDVWPFSAMALHTAVLFIVASVGILCAQPDKGPLSMLTESGIGSSMARRLLPFAIVLPLLVGWLRLQGERAGLYGFEFGLALFATSNVILFTALVWITALSLNRADAKRQDSEASLVNSEHRFRALLEHSSDSISLIDKDNRILYLSPAVATVEGYSQEELMGRNGVENTHPDDLPLLHKIVGQLIDNPGLPVPVLWRRRHKDGHWLWLEGVATNLLHDPAVAAIVTNYRDVTGRIQAEEALRASEAQLWSFVEQAPVSIAMFDRRMVYLAASRRWVADYGNGHQDLVGKSHYEVHTDIPEDRREIHRRGLAGEAQKRDEDLWIQADGTRKWLRWAVQPWLNAQGEIGGIMILAEDITQRVLAEEEIRRLNAELEQRVADRTTELHAKNKELETFTYSVSHDLKAPLRGIDGYSRLLLDQHHEKLDEDGRGFLKNICNAATQMQQLIDDLLAFSRLERRNLLARRLDPRKLVEELVAERKFDLDRVRIVVDVATEAVRADREGLALALRNLIDNAVKFSGQRSPPVIELRSRLEGGRHILSVRDNGIGFDMKYHDRIFQIFQRLHRAEDYAGTGVGLAIVHKAMERMDGRVWAQSEPGNGATFYLDLPRDCSTVTTQKGTEHAAPDSVG